MSLLQSLPLTRATRVCLFLGAIITLSASCTWQAQPLVSTANIEAITDTANISDTVNFTDTIDTTNSGDTTNPVGITGTADVIEQAVTVIPLQGPLTQRTAELSGLAWYGDHLILLPQYPYRFQDQLFYLTKQDIVSFLEGNSQEPLSPQSIPLAADDLLAHIGGFQGFEAIAFTGDRLFLTIEAEVKRQMRGYLVAGVIAPDSSEIRLELSTLTEIPPQTNLRNLGDEAIVLVGKQILTLYEANGFLINLSPMAHLFNLDDLQPLGAIPVPPINYRITDATSLDADERFWVINSFYADNYRLIMGLDPIAMRYGVGSTHRQSNAVERLVELQYSPAGIMLVDTPPIQLQLSDGVGRNWEGIARLDDPEHNGFLLVTDRRPETILAFVPDVRD